MMEQNQSTSREPPAVDAPVQQDLPVEKDPQFSDSPYRNDQALDISFSKPLDSTVETEREPQRDGKLAKDRVTTTVEVDKLNQSGPTLGESIRSHWNGLDTFSRSAGMLWAVIGAGELMLMSVCTAANGPLTHGSMALVAAALSYFYLSGSRNSIFGD